MAQTSLAFAQTGTESMPSAEKAEKIDGHKEEWARRLAGYKERGRGDPLFNPIQQLSFDIADAIRRGDLTHDLLTGLVQQLTVSAFRYRAKRLEAYVGECDPAKNTDNLRRLFEALAERCGSGEEGFRAFQAQVKRELAGVVITAHPTFGISQELTQILARLASGRDEHGQPLTAEAEAALLSEAARNPHGLPQGITLEEEHVFSLEAIRHIQKGLERIYDILFTAAAERYPEHWEQLTPRMLTVASWVGYDLDGRADIRWTDTLRARMRVQALQLSHYAEEIRAITTALTEAGALSEDLSPNLRLMDSQIAFAHRMVVEDMELLLGAEDDEEKVRSLGQRLAHSKETRLLNCLELITILDRAVTLCTHPESRHRLAVLRAAMTNLGLGGAHAHVRLNATQLDNAVRKSVGLESGPDDPGNRRRYLKTLTSMLDKVEPVSINFGSLMQERSSARRMFMLVRQFLHYVDSDQPVRFLIAECETAFTVLSALYLARLFGVDERVDISPLFETSKALRHGHEVIAELLDNPHYLAYVKKRGRLSIQTGFSDAGRYIGQVAASLAIERLRMKIAELLKARGLTELELVVFDTHGESIGRGSHPASLLHRLNHVAPPAARLRSQQLDLQVKEEISFQGGDGYVFFTNDNLAFATLSRLLEHALTPPNPAALEDPFYKDTDYSLEFFITAKSFNERLMENSDYAALLGAFGPNLFYPTGSRMVKRQHEGTSSIDRGHPSQIRAIPHNGILQQFGLMANSFGGVGEAIAIDRERFLELYQESERCRSLTSLAAYAYRLSNLDAFRAYVALFDPMAWLHRAFDLRGTSRGKQMRRLSRLLQESGRAAHLYDVFHVLLQDTLDLCGGLDALATQGTLEFHDTFLPTETEMDLALLHALRLALIQEIFLLVTRIPRFSSQPDVTIDEVVQELLELDVQRALDALVRAFPVAASMSCSDASFGERANYQCEGEEGYGFEHRHLFDPIRNWHHMIRRISTAVTHIMGAVG